MTFEDIPKELRPGKNEGIAVKTLEDISKLVIKPGFSHQRLTRAATGSNNPESSKASLAPPLSPKKAKRQQQIATPLLQKGLAAEADQSNTPSVALVENTQPSELQRGRSIKRMSNARSRASRGGGRGGMNETGEEVAIWKDIRDEIAKVAVYEKRATELLAQMEAKEAKMKAMKDLGKEPSPQEISELDDMYREQVRIADNQKALIGSEGASGLLQSLNILTAVQKSNEEKEDMNGPRSTSTRDTHPRTTVDYDVSDSPAPPSGDPYKRNVKGVSGDRRTSSQPPRNSAFEVVVKSDSVSEPSERTGKPKIVYAIKDEVAFKRKNGDEHDWIQGEVTRIIGEGKSRRYEVKDPFPDAGTPPSETLHKSSASQMVPIPKKDVKLEPYEIGKRVLALYPATSTFYRAEVKGILDGGARVQLLFEGEESAEEPEKIVDRRMVLDHKG
ncbi:hypothetical protein G7Y89_g7591 [Cudoniella acicularis]|uniref:SGF29 C-terminal domain-containing protein n=1 Tax=Cudoniella acicularis TaxID=354080 RepID=A0A8H4RKM6_9HELO|nr:hypothetical protein G7Y89_g7591 [Cudoniella acicularis]